MAYGSRRTLPRSEGTVGTALATLARLDDLLQDPTASPRLVLDLRDHVGVRIVG